MMLVLLILSGFLVLIAFALGLYSHRSPTIGMIDGRLENCPDKPNCVCSEAYAQHDRNSVQALSTSGLDAQTLWRRLIEVIASNGGEIRQHNATYLHATFTSSLFRFVDDVEFRLDAEHRQLHIRSASRVGYSDLGANRKRVERIRTGFEQQSTQH